MKKLILLVALTSFVFAGSVRADDSPWFDMQNCAMCKSMGDMMNHVTMETHVLSDGMLSLTIVDPDYADKWAKVHQEMGATAQKVMAGEDLYVCNSCKSLLHLMQAGAEVQNVDSPGTHSSMMLVTSDKPELAKMIQDHAKRNIEEMAKMMGDEK